MKTTLMALVFLTSPIVLANDTVALNPIKFEVVANNAHDKFEQTLNNPEGLLKRFKPVGAKITNKEISRNVISFTATKTVFFVSKSVYVKGILDAREDNKLCRKNEYGYSLNMNFDASDRLVSDNVERIESTICLSKQSDNKITGVSQSKIIIGNNYSSALGPIAIGLIKEQVPALINALSEEIKSLR